MPTIAYPTLVPRSDDTLRLELPSGTGIRLVGMVEPESFIDTVNEYLFGLVVATGGRTETKPLLRRLLLAVPDAHLVLILLDGRSSRDLDLMAGSRIVVFPDAIDSPALVPVLRGVWFEGQVERVRSAALAGPLPASLLCAVSKILKERVTAKNPEPDEVRLCTTLIDLSERCGVNKDTLQRARKRFDLDLGAMMKEWRVALALREYFIEDDPPLRGVWHAIGRRCGYEGESGIRGLIARVLGVGLESLRFGHLHELMTRLHSRVVDAEAR